MFGLTIQRRTGDGAFAVMRNRLIVLVLLLLAASATPASAQFLPLGLGKSGATPTVACRPLASGINPPIVLAKSPPLLCLTAAPPPSYQGPADVATATDCLSVRACSVATRGTKAITVCTAADASCEDESTDATTGDLVLGTLAAACTTTCLVQTWWDQLSGPTGYFNNGTAANQPVFLKSCPTTGKPCVQWAGTSCLQSSTNPAINYANAVSIVINDTSTTSPQYFYFMSGEPVELGISASTVVRLGTAIGTSPSYQTQTLASGTWAAIQGAVNNDSGTPGTSSFAVNGTTVTATMDAQNSSGAVIKFSATNCSSPTDGIVGYTEEFVLNLSGTFTGGQITALTSNQRAYYGF
jgi:hypothetical protein